MRTLLTLFLCLTPTLELPAQSPSTAQEVEPTLGKLIEGIEAVAKSQWEAHQAYDDIQALAKMGAAARPALPALVSLLGVPNYRHVPYVLRAIASIGPELDLLLHRLLSGDPGVAAPNSDFDLPLYRERIAIAIANMGLGAAPAIAPLTHALIADGPLDTKRAAAHCLGLVQARMTESSVAGLIAGLETSDLKLRLEAAKLLAEIGPAARQALPSLLLAARGSVPQDPNDVDSKQEVAQPLNAFLDAIERIAESDAASHLLMLADVPALAQSTNLLLRLAQRSSSMSKSSRESFRKLLQRDLNHADSQTQMNAARCLAELGSGAHAFVPNLLALYTNSNASSAARRQALTTLANLPEESVRLLPYLFASLKALHPQQETKLLRSTIFVLGYIGPEATGGVPQLIHILELRNKDLIRSVVDALASIGPGAKAALGPLRILAGEELDNEYLDEAIAQAIKQIEAHD